MKDSTTPISKEDEITPQQASTFYSGYQQVKLPPGTLLWRFVSKKNFKKFSDFWIDSPTMTTIMNSLHDNGIFSESYKKENIRNSLAILEPWSNLSWRLKVRLLKETIAYQGATGTQKLFEDQPNPFPFAGPDKVSKVIETRLGRMVQYVIPRFKNLPDNNPWATIEMLVHI